MTTYKDFILPESIEEIIQLDRAIGFKTSTFGFIATPYVMYKDSNHMSVPLSTNISRERLEEDILDEYINIVKVFIDEYYKCKEEEDK